MAGCCEYVDEPSGSGATELVHTHLWNVGLFQRDYTALYLGRLLSAYSPPWDPEPTQVLTERSISNAVMVHSTVVSFLTERTVNLPLNVVDNGGPSGAWWTWTMGDPEVADGHSNLQAPNLPENRNFQSFLPQIFRRLPTLQKTWDFKLPLRWVWRWQTAFWDVAPCSCCRTKEQVGVCKHTHRLCP
jgi:hypothetical protein